MHEHSITNEIIHQIIHMIEDNKIVPEKIIIELGELTTYKKEPVEMYFNEYKRNHEYLKDTKLEITEVKGKIMCNECNKESRPEISPLIVCSNCSSTDITVLAGNEITIKEIS